MLHTFSELFGGLIGDLDGQINDSALEEVFVTCCDLDVENRNLTLHLSSNAYISGEALYAVKQKLTRCLSLAHLEMYTTFAPKCFSAASCADIVMEIRRRSAMLNGYFNKAEYRIEGNKVIMDIKFGGIDTIMLIKAG